MDRPAIASVFDARAERYAGDDWHRRYARRIGPAGHVVGVDLSPGMLTQARRGLEAAAIGNVEFVEADATDLAGLARVDAGRRGVRRGPPVHARGTDARCRAALEAAGFVKLQVLDARVDFESLDPVLAWDANFRAAGVFGAHALSTEAQAALRARYLRALDEARRTDLAATAGADVLFAVGYR